MFWISELLGPRRYEDEHVLYQTMAQALIQTDSAAFRCAARQQRINQRWENYCTDRTSVVVRRSFLIERHIHKAAFNVHVPGSRLGHFE